MIRRLVRTVEGRAALRGGVTQGAAFVLLRVARFAVLPFVFRALSESELGLYGLLQTGYVVAFTLFGAGTGSSVVRAAADQRTGAVASHVVGRSVAAVLATLCLAPTLLFVAPPLAPAAASAVLAVALGLVMEGTYHAARSAGRHRLCALLLTVNSLTWAALVVALVLVEGWGVTGLMLALAGSHLAGWCVGLLALGPSAWSGATRPEMVRQLRFGAPIALTDILHVAAGLDRLVVQQLLGLARAGVYHFATVFMDPLLLLDRAAVVSSEPWLYAASPEQLRERVAHLMRTQSALHLAAAVCLAALATEIAWVLGPASYADALWAAPVLLLVPVLGTQTRLVGFGAAHRSRTGVLAMAAATDLALALGLAWLLAPAFDLLGVGVARAIGALAGLAVAAWSTQRLIGKLPVLPVALAGAFTALLCVALASPLLSLPIWVRLPLGALAAVALAAGLWPRDTAQD